MQLEKPTARFIGAPDLIIVLWQEKVNGIPVLMASWFGGILKMVNAKTAAEQY